MFLERVHEIPGGRIQLDEISRRLFGKRYTALTYEEANAVWDEIERQEAGQQP